LQSLSSTEGGLQDEITASTCCESGMREWNVGMVCVLFSYLSKVRAKKCANLT